MDSLHKNIRPVARTLSEANRDADYATALWECESENKSAMRTLGFIVGVSIIGLFAVFVATAVLTWFGVIVW